MRVVHGLFVGFPFQFTLKTPFSGGGQQGMELLTHAITLFRVSLLVLVLVLVMGSSFGVSFGVSFGISFE